MSIRGFSKTRAIWKIIDLSLHMKTAWVQSVPVSVVWGHPSYTALLKLNDEEWREALKKRKNVSLVTANLSKALRSSGMFTGIDSFIPQRLRKR